MVQIISGLPRDEKPHLLWKLLWLSWLSIATIYASDTGQSTSSRVAMQSIVTRDAQSVSISKNLLYYMHVANTLSYEERRDVLNALPRYQQASYSSYRYFIFTEYGDAIDALYTSIASPRAHQNISHHSSSVSLSLAKHVYDAGEVFCEGCKAAWHISGRQAIPITLPEIVGAQLLAWMRTSR